MPDTISRFTCREGTQAELSGGSPGPRPPGTSHGLCLTRKEIFIRYSTPSFSTKDCFLKLSRSPAPKKKIVLKGSAPGSCSPQHLPSAAARHSFRSHPDPHSPRQPHPGSRPLHSQSLQTFWLHFSRPPQEGTRILRNYFPSRNSRVPAGKDLSDATHLSGPAPGGPGPCYTPGSGGSQQHWGRWGLQSESRLELYPTPDMPLGRGELAAETQK